MLESDRLRIAEGVNYQSLGDAEDGVLLSMSSGYLYRCNRAALEILNLVQGQPSYGTLVTRFARHFHLEETQARADVSAFIDHLLEEQLIARVA